MKRCEQADTIIRILLPGLETDVRFWEKFLKHIHKAELPLVEEHIALNRKLMEEMNKYLAEFGQPEYNQQKI